MSLEYRLYTTLFTKARLVAAFVSFIFLSAAVALTMQSFGGAQSASIGEARKAFGEYRLADGLKHLEAALAVESDYFEAIYLKGEALVLNGRPEVWDIIQQLKAAGKSREADILSLKVDLFLGDENLAKSTSFLATKYPGDPEIELVDWLRRLDGGDIEWAEGHLPDPDCLVMCWVPYRALSIAWHKEDPVRSAEWAERGLEYGAKYFQRVLEVIRCYEGWPQVSHEIIETELPYVECGPYFGIRMEDEEGHSIKVSLDTGTNGRGFTIHDRSVGALLSGEVLLVREKAIQYNYMSEAVDAVYKRVNFRSPRILNLPVICFQGALSNGDGVFSPFAFPDLAVTIDPVNRKAWLRNREALKRYLKGLSGAVMLPYRERDGWIFVSGRLDGKGALLMVETGSRDVNANRLAAKRYGLPTKPGRLVWQEKERHVKRPDFVFDIGGIAYTPSDGLVDDFALGSFGIGLGSAGDIGPVFLKNYRFTIDPFAKRIILEPAQLAPSH